MHIGSVLIYGGSFDPPHIGHTGLLSAAIRKLNPDIVYLLPAYHSPFKGLPVTSFMERSRMMRLAVAEKLSPRMRRIIKIHPFEMLRGRTTYTYQSIRYFRRRHPGAKIYLLIGSDCLAQFNKWRKHREIAKSCTIVVGRRREVPLPQSLLGKRPCPGRISLGRKKFNFDVLPGWFPCASSASLRKDIFSGAMPSKLIASSVRGRILRKGLYGMNIQKWLKKHLSARRFRHTLAVSRTAQELASRYGVDLNTAAMAALLHDAGKGLSAKGLIKYVRGSRICVPECLDTIRNQPALLHPYVSADIARRIFGVTNPGVLSAIRLHTLGTKKMSLLDKIIYIADISSEDRDFPRAGAIRSLAFKDLDGALLLAAKEKLQYVLAGEKWMHPSGVKLWNRLNRK